jgi:hypothetical protein
MKTENWKMIVMGVVTTLLTGAVFFGLITADQSAEITNILETGILGLNGITIASLAAFLAMVSGLMLLFSKQPKTEEMVSNATGRAGWITTATGILTVLLMALVVFQVIDPATQGAILTIFNDTMSNLGGTTFTAIDSIIGGIAQVLMLFVKDPELPKR